MATGNDIEFEPDVQSAPAAIDFTPESTVPDGAVDFIKQREGFVPKATWDVRQWSVGYGSRGKQGEVLTPAQADIRLREELAGHAQRVDEAAAKHGFALNDNQRSALISFDFNSGQGHEAIARIAKGGDKAGLSYMASYLSPDPRYREGLAKRRLEEINLFRKPADAKIEFEPDFGFEPDTEKAGRDAKVDELTRVGIDKVEPQSGPLQFEPLPREQVAEPVRGRRTTAAEEALTVQPFYARAKKAMEGPGYAAGGGNLLGGGGDYGQADVAQAYKESVALFPGEPDEVKRRWDDAHRLDFAASTKNPMDGTQLPGMGPARVLSDQTLIVNPSLAFDAKAWDDAVNGATTVTPAARELAKRQRIAVRDDLAENLLPLLEKTSKWNKFVESNPGMSDGEALELFRQKHGDAASNLPTQTALGIEGGVASVSKSIYGLGAMFGSQTARELADIAKENEDQLGAVSQALQGGAWAKTLSGTATAMAPMFLGGGITGASILGGVQQTGGTYIEARNAGFSPLESAGLALGEGVIEAGVQRAFGTTGIESVFGKAAKGPLWKRVAGGILAEEPEELLTTALQHPFEKTIDPNADLASSLGETAWTTAVISGGINAARRQPSPAPAPTQQPATVAGENVPQNFAPFVIEPEPLDAAAGAAAFGTPAPAPTQEAPSSVAPDENFARETSFPRGLLPFISPEEAGALMTTIGTSRQVGALTTLLQKARDRSAATAAAVAPAPTPQATAQESATAPTQEVSAPFDATAQSIDTTETASAQDATSPSQAEEDSAGIERDGRQHLADTDLSRRLESKDKSVRHNAERELMTRQNLGWSNKPEQAAVTQQFHGELKQRIATREARWQAESDRAAQEAGIELLLDESTVPAEAIPFSQSPEHHPAIASAVRETLAELGVTPDIVTAEVVPDVDAIPEANARQAAMASRAAGNVVKAFYTPATSTTPAKVTLNAAVVRTPELARVAVLHEVAGHHGLRAVFAKARPAWDAIVNRLYTRISKVQFDGPTAKRLGYQSLAELQEIYHRPEAGQNYDPATPEGRSNLIEEHLATLAQSAKTPGWFSELRGQIKDIIRKVSGGKMFKNFTDADVDRLLAKARRAAKGKATPARTSPVKFSQERAERDARSVERALTADEKDLREYQTQLKAKESPEVADPVKQALNGLYAIYTDKAAIADAQAWVNREGADNVEAQIIGKTALDKRDTAAARLLLQRHSASGLHERYRALLNRVMMTTNTQAQALQAMHLLFDTTTPEGALNYVQREVNKAAAEAVNSDPEKARLAKMVEELQKQLEKFRVDAATARILEAQKIIADAADLTPEKKVELNHKLRDMLTNDDGSTNTEVRVRGLLIAAGADVKKADALAKSLVKQFRKRLSTARAQVLKQILTIPQATKRLGKGLIGKWQELNDQGTLTDARLFASFSSKFGFPVFTAEDAAHVKGMMAEYAKRTDAELKFDQAAKFLEWVEQRVAPAGIFEKMKSLFTLTKLTSFKTIERNVAGNLLAAAAHSVAIDVPQWILGAGWNLMRGQRIAPLDTQLGNYVRGNAEVARLYKLGRDYAVQEGAGKWQGVKAGFDTLLRAARYHTGGITDASGIKRAHRSVFTSAAGRMFENSISAALILPDLGRFYGEVRASLARQLAATSGATTLPTAEMYEQAYLDGQRSIWQDDNAYTAGAKGIQQLGNLIGLGKPTGKTGLGKYSRQFGLGNAIVTFARVPANLLREGVAWSPLGYLRALYQGVNSFKGIESPRRAVQTLLKASAGTMGLQPLGAWLYTLGILTGAGDDDKDVAALQRATGWQNYSLNWSMLKRRILTGNWHTPIKAQEGDVFWSYGWAQPLAFSLAAGAEQARAAAERGTPAAWWSRENLLDGLKGGVSALGEQPLVSGLSMFARDIANDFQQDSLAHTARVVIRLADFVPAIVRDIRYMGNNTVPETRSANWIQAEFDRITGGIPGVNLPARYNVLGQAEQRYKVAGNSWLNVLFNPFTVSQLKATPAAAEAMRLAEAGEAKAAPSAVARTISVRADGKTPQKLPLTNAEISEMQRLTGQLTANAHAMRLVNPAWASYSDATKAKLFADDVAGAQNAAKAILHGHKLWSVSLSGLDVDKRAAALGFAAYNRGILTKADYAALLKSLSR